MIKLAITARPILNSSISMVRLKWVWEILVWINEYCFKRWLIDLNRRHWRQYGSAFGLSDYAHWGQSFMKLHLSFPSCWTSLLRSSLSVSTFFPISEFSYFVIGFLNHFFLSLIFPISFKIKKNWRPRIFYTHQVEAEANFIHPWTQLSSPEKVRLC